MKIDANKLAKHLAVAGMGGLINELVLNDDLSFSATDEGKWVLVSGKGGKSKTGFGKIGIYGVEFILKVIGYVSDAIYKGKEIELTVEGNKLVFKEGNNEFKFQLSDPKVVSSTVDNFDGAFAKVTEGACAELELTKEASDRLMKAVALLESRVVTLFVSEGDVVASLGEELEHNACVELGKVDAEFPATKILLNTSVLKKMLDVLPKDQKITLELRADRPVVVTCGGYTLLLNQSEG